MVPRWLGPAAGLGLWEGGAGWRRGWPRLEGWGLAAGWLWLVREVEGGGGLSGDDDEGPGEL